MSEKSLFSNARLLFLLLPKHTALADLVSFVALAVALLRESLLAMPASEWL